MEILNKIRKVGDRIPVGRTDITSRQQHELARLFLNHVVSLALVWVKRQWSSAHPLGQHWWGPCTFNGPQGPQPWNQRKLGYRRKARWSRHAKHYSLHEPLGVLVSWWAPSIFLWIRQWIALAGGQLSNSIGLMARWQCLTRYPA